MESFIIRPVVVSSMKFTKSNKLSKNTIAKVEIWYTIFG